MRGLTASFQYISEKEITLKNVKNIILAGDVGCTGFDDENKRVLKVILSAKADIFLILGDIAFSGSEEEFRKVKDFCAANTRIPIFALRGNHDLPSYSDFFGKPYYAVLLENAILIFLDNAPGRFSEESIAFLNEELERHADKKAFVLFHVPPPTNICRACLSSEEWMRLRPILDKYKNNIEAVISAHIHGHHEYSVDGYRVLITAGGGAAMIYELLHKELMVHNFLKMSILQDGSAEFTNVLIGKE